jgi:hypothetical protein
VRSLTDVSKDLRPQPPDFTAFSLQPQWSFNVITNGYRGTAMPGYGSLPEGVRWGLVKVVQEKRMGGSAATRSDAGTDSQ